MFQGSRCLFAFFAVLPLISCRTTSDSATKSAGDMFPGGAEILSGSLTSDKKAIRLKVKHGGGCGDHVYTLDVGGCLESMPVQCGAKLIHMTNDICEALLEREAVISLADAKLTDPYYSQASLNISGANGSHVQITLPALDGKASSNSNQPAAAGAKAPKDAMFNEIAKQAKNLNYIGYDVTACLDANQRLIAGGVSFWNTALQIYLVGANNKTSATERIGGKPQDSVLTYRLNGKRITLDLGQAEFTNDLTVYRKATLTSAESGAQNLTCYVRNSGLE